VQRVVSSFVRGVLHPRMLYTAHIPVRGYCYNERCHNSAAACYFTPTALAVTISESHVAESKNGNDDFWTGPCTVSARSRETCTCETRIRNKSTRLNKNVSPTSLSTSVPQTWSK
jgi:hypothetical protein